MPRRISRAALAALLLVLLLGPPADATRIVPNDSATVADMRTMVSAQHAYSAANGARIAKGRENFDARLVCLLDTQTCVPGYTGPAMLDAVFAHAMRHGYVFTLHSGPAPAPEAVKAAAASPSTVHEFAYVGVPLRPVSKHGGIVACLSGRGDPTGRRGYCADGTGIICYTNDGSPPPVKNGHCEPCPNKVL